MNNPENKMFGTKVLEEITSPINGRIRVLRSLGLGTHIQAEGLTQSGGVVAAVWERALKEVKRPVGNCLILGLGGGTAAGLVRKRYPDAHITGVDLDPIMVGLGRKYLGLEGVDIIIADAEKYSVDAFKNSRQYDLILVDIYTGDKFPPKFERDDFLLRLKKLSGGGLTIFNRLYYGEKRPEAMRFAAKLEAVFPKVEYVFPEANLMLLCS